MLLLLKGIVPETTKIEAGYTRRRLAPIRRMDLSLMLFRSERQKATVRRISHELVAIIVEKRAILLGIVLSLLRYLCLLILLNCLFVPMH